MTAITAPSGSASGITAISTPLPGERVLALSPETASEAATTWRRRPNLFPGRTLTTATLELSQNWQAGHIAQRAQAFSAGVVNGLEVGTRADTSVDSAQPSVQLRIAAGLALTVTGEDLRLPSDVECDWYALPVVAPPGLFSGVADDGTGARGTLLAREIGPLLLGEVLAQFPGVLPAAGVLVAQPVRFDLSDADPNDPCDQCPCGEGITSDSISDQRVADAVRLLWYAWPTEWRPLPTNPNTRRNELAHSVFEAERQLAVDECLPWEQWGAPLALIGVDESNYAPLYADRNAVVRRGGRARDDRLQVQVNFSGNASVVRGNPRLPGLYQAQIEQFAEQIAAAGDPTPPVASYASSLRWLPPAGLLPKNAVNLANHQSSLFPTRVVVDAVPVPYTELDAALRASAALNAFDRAPSREERVAAGERVRVLVPVSEASFEPRLLLKEVIDEAFQNAVDEFRLRRARALGQRQALRVGQAVLTRAIKGSAPTVPAISADPLALEQESLAPWGPPPATGGHRTSLAAGYHQHYFLGATESITPAAGSSLYFWVCIDPDHPPRSLVLQWHAGGNWEHRAYWGENLFGYGVDGSSSRLAQGALPDSGRWLRLAVPAAAVDTANRVIDGIAFGVFDGRAAFGATGFAPAGAADSVWFGDRLPAGAVQHGNYAWQFLPPELLGAPFEASSYGLAPNASSQVAAGTPIPGVVSAVAALDAGNPDGPLSALSAHERGELAKRGLEGFIAYLKQRTDRVDDYIDLHFTKVQTDIYRARQLLLGNAEALRLAVSPTLANIAKSDTAVASQQQISDYLKATRLNTVVTGGKT